MMKKSFLTSLFYCFMVLSLMGQRQVSGTITLASDGSLLPGVNVVVKGTEIGVATDIDGKYSIQVPEGSQTLVFSLIGMKTKESAITGSVVNITMEEDVTLIDEVVVTGFQKIDKRLFTGSATRVSNEEVKLEGVADISRSLQGQVAGIQVENVSGTFGTAPIVRVRGVASVRGNNRPLWVIDGVVLEDFVELTAEDITTGNLNTVLSSSTVGINPEDIESFQILKDASATALYGARAMNGVIVVTTKQGKLGKLSVNYTTNFTMKSKPVYDQYNILTSGAEMALYQELYEKEWIDIASANVARHHGALSNMFYQIANRNIPWRPNGTLNYDYLQRYADANTDWFDLLFRNSISQQHSLSFTAGSKKTQLRTSLGFYTDPGQTIADKVKNYTASMYANFNLTEKLKLGIKLTGNIRDQILPGSQDRTFNPISGEYERNFDINPFNYALYTARSITPYDENGNRQYFRRNFAPFNILEEIDLNKIDLDLSDITIQADINYDFLPHLTWRTSLQARWGTTKAVHNVHENSNEANAYRADEQLFRERNNFLYDDPSRPNLDPYSILPQGGFKKTTDNTITNYFVRNTLEYNPVIHEDHVITTMLGQELRRIDRTHDYFEGWGYLFDAGGFSQPHPDFIKYLNQRLDENEQPTTYFSSKETRVRSFGVFFYGGYAYKGKYILNGTFRYDGDNRTGTSSTARYLPTWNISGAWIVTEENWQWVKDLDWLNLLKLKTTYGLTGDNPLDASAALTLYGYTPTRPQETETETGLNIAALENPDLTFEKLYELNVGLEAALFNNRIHIDFDYYRRNSKDLLGTIETNAVGGIQQKVGNIGEMKIHGFDLTLQTRNIEKKNFKWSSSFTFSHSKNEITKWENFDRIADVLSRNGGNLEGYAKGSLFSIPFAGLNKKGIPTFYDKDGNIIQENNFQARENILVQLKYEGPTIPEITGGLINSFTYKQWNLSIGLVYNYGNKIRLDDVYFSRYNDHRAYPGDMINRWQLPGDELRTNIPTIPTARESEALTDAELNPYEMYNKSDIRVAEGDFIRLKSAKIGYTLPHRFLENTFIRSAGISLSGYNLWLIHADDRLNGVDPEFYQSGGISTPLTSYYTLSLNIKF